MRRVQVHLEVESNWHADGVVLLEDLAVLLVTLGADALLDRNDLFLTPACSERHLHNLTQVLAWQNKAWGFPDGDAFFGRDKFVVDLDDHLADASERVLQALVVVVEAEAGDLSFLSEVDLDRVVLSFVEGNEPHVAIVDGVVLVVEQFFECTVVLLLTRNAVHVAGTGVHCCK